MASLGMGSAYPLTNAKIDEVVTRVSAGNYALGHTSGNFMVKYVGRSDSDLKAELKARLNPKYQQFKFIYAASPTAAYEKESRNYHDFGGSAKLDNEIHPAKPPVFPLSPCPVAGCNN